MAVDTSNVRQTPGKPKAEHGDRQTEDDIAKAKLGPLGIPGAPD